jgi:hypothetical protein
MTAPLASIVVAIVAATISLISLGAGFFTSRKLEEFKSQLAASQAAANRADEAQRLVARYRDPLLRTAYDFQSRLYNIHRPGGFRVGPDPEYFYANTLFVIAEFLGWLEIIRRDMQFLDMGAIDATSELNARIAKIQDCLASTSHTSDAYYLYRGQQRAIGELMIAPVESKMDRPGPRYETIGYAAFWAKMKDADYSRWFERLREQLPALPEKGSVRLIQVQHVLIDLIDMLDPNCKWHRSDRGRLQAPPDCRCLDCTPPELDPRPD